MIKKASAVIVFFLVYITLFAQLPDKVGSLFTVDKNAAILAERSGPHTAYSSVIDKESMFFVPSVVNAQNYLNNRPNLPDVMSWNPNFALVSRSMDWGVTSGPIQFQKSGSIKRYGQYVTIWKRDRKGKWRIHVRAEVENYGTGKSAGLTYSEPDDQHYLKHRSKVRLDQREEVVFQTDKLFSNVLKASTKDAYKEFLADDVRYYFPWKAEVVGKENVLAMFTKDRIEIDTEPEAVGRAYSGEFAYTSGTATVGQKDKVQKFNYVRIWQLTNDFEWKIMLEMMFER